MRGYAFTDYFEKQVLRKRAYLTKDRCVYVIENAEKSEPQEHARHRFWAAIPELGGRYLRVVTLADRPSTESREISAGVVLDYDADGRLVGIDIDNATNKVELKRLVLGNLPAKVETAAA